MNKHINYSPPFSPLLPSPQVDDAMQHIEDIDSSITKLEQCEYSSAVMAQVLEDIQKVVDKLNLRSYTNLSKWVQKLDSKVRCSGCGQLERVWSVGCV